MDKSTIIYYPRMRNRVEIADAISRAAWYFQPWLANIQAVVVGIDNSEVPARIEAPDTFDAGVNERLDKIAHLISIQKISNAALAQMARNEKNVILLNWDEGVPPPSDVVKKLQAQGRFYRVDPNATRYEGSHYLWAGRNAFGATAAAIAESKLALQRFAAIVHSENVYVFGTGPSLRRLQNYDFPNGQAIAINSMVRNTELLDRLDLAAITAGDPIFHAGVSRYAAAFRKELLACLEKYQPFLFVPMRDFEMYKCFIPVRHHERIVGLPFEARKPYNIDLKHEFYVSPMPNILTMAVLPIGATFFKNILASGCDGRPRAETSYFWSHDNKSQFNDEMENIKLVHPAFFQIDYDDYYLEHVKTVAEAVDAIEVSGKRVTSLTPSFIPALGSRYRGITAPDVLCIDPDGVSEAGHYLNYDDLLAGEAARRGVGFSVLGPIRARPEVTASRPHFRPTFSRGSWYLRSRPEPPGAANLAEFRRELSTALAEKGRQRPMVLFMYCASLESAVEIAEAIESFPDVSACVNLFWLSLLDLEGAEYAGRGKILISRLSRAARITLMASTGELAKDIKEAFGVELAVLPHPSTTYPDIDFESASGRPSRARGQKTKVLFPGSGTKGKGWAETIAALPLLAHELGDSCEFQLRAAPGSAVVEGSRDALETMRGEVTLIEGKLSRDEFKQMMAESDIVVLPYDPHAFRNRTSGLLADTLHAGKPAIVIQGSWLGTVVNEFGSGVAVESGAPESLLAGIRAVIADYEKYAAAAEAGCLRFAEGNSWKALLDVILGSTEFKASLAETDAAAPKPELPSTPAFETIPISRDEQAQIDECRLIFEVAQWSQPKGIMIDVGAHHGSSLSRFAGAGWRVIAFEPDSANRQELVKKHGRNKNILIFGEAVADVAGQSVPFYASDESTGISGLMAFRESHREVGRVRTTTLNEIVARHRLAQVDFLKIDVEGFEMAVLRGLDFDRLKPSVIMAEFEDAKSGSAGHTSQDIAGFLFDRGYAVYVSEWHPIERYGVRHSFRRLRKYPCDVPSSSWGNLIAFREDPEPAALQRAIRAAVDRPIEFEGGDEEDLAEARHPQQAAQWTVRMRAKFADLARPMRRRPFISAFLAVTGASLLVVIAARPYLSAVSTPELLLVLLGANLLLTALVARIVRKSLIGRMSDLAQRPEDTLKRAEARSQQVIKAKSQGTEDRIMSDKRAKFTDLARPMRRRPFVTAFVAVVGVAALVLIATRPYLSAIATPELLLVLLGANLLLTALVARIVRKSLIARLSDFVQRTEDTLKRAEARSQHLIKLLGPEDRIMSEMRRRSETRDPDVGTLADELAHQAAGASQPGQPSVGQTEETRARNLEHTAGAERLVAEQALAGADIATASAEIGGIGAGPEVNGAANGNPEPTIGQSIAAPALIAPEGDSGPRHGSTHQGGNHADRD